MNTELTVELNCGRCNFTKVITIKQDKDGVFTIPNKFCPNDLNGLSRTILSNEPIEDKTRTPDSVSKPTRILERPQNGDSDPKKS